jgi:hypothetical protein
MALATVHHEDFDGPHADNLTRPGQSTMLVAVVGGPGRRQRLRWRVELIAVDAYTLGEAVHGYDGDEDHGRAVLEQGGEWIATLGDMTDLADWSMDQVEAAVAAALRVDVADVTARPTGPNIAGSTYPANVATTSLDWAISVRRR